MRDRRQQERRGTRFSRAAAITKSRVCILIALTAAWVGGCTVGQNSVLLAANEATTNTLYSGTPIVIGATEYKHLFSLWMVEANRRFANPVVVFCHGDTYIDAFGNPQWYAFPDVRPPLPVHTLALELKQDYPGRDIVLVICNPDGLELGVPGVHYSRGGSVWIVPDRNLSIRSTIDPSAIGNVNDMISE